MKKHLIILSVLCLAAMTLRAQDTTAVCPHGKVRLSCDCGCHNRPVNDYDGLNSLRARLANPGWDGSIPNIGTGIKLEGGRIKPWVNRGTKKETEEHVTVSANTTESDMDNDSPYLNGIGRGEVSVGPPVYVFFCLAGTRFTDPSQVVSVNSAADLALAQNLRVRIIGAADSATGSVGKNAELAIARAEYVMRLFKERGVDVGKIEIRSEGGTDKLSPVSVNRNCRIELYVK